MCYFSWEFKFRVYINQGFRKCVLLKKKKTQNDNKDNFLKIQDFSLGKRSDKTFMFFNFPPKKWWNSDFINRAHKLSSRPVRVLLCELELAVCEKSKRIIFAPEWTCQKASGSRCTTSPPMFSGTLNRLHQWANKIIPSSVHFVTSL